MNGNRALLCLTLLAACGGAGGAGDDDGLGPDGGSAATPDADLAAPDADLAAPDGGTQAAVACDPITQKSATDTADTFCGAPAGEMQCAGTAWGQAGPAPFACMPVLHPERTQGYVLAPGAHAANDCAPGHVAEGNLCRALCLAGPTSTTTPENARGVAPLTLTQNGVTDVHEECRYWWLFEGEYTSTYSNTLGLAFNFYAEQFSSCAELIEGSYEHTTLGCAPRVAP